MSFDRIPLSQEILVAAIGDDWPADQVEAAIELLANSEGRFPAGVRKLPPELVKAVQRERLVVAMLMAAAELGYRETNVQDVIDRAGVSRPTFYEHFSNKEDCFLAAFDTSAARLRSKVDAAAASGGEVWRDRLRRSLEALIEFAIAEPQTARTLIVEARAASADAVMRRVQLLEHFANCLDAEVSDLLPPGSYSAITAAGVVGGVEALLYARLCKEELDNLEQLLPSLMYFAVLPYEGHEAANEELAIDAG
ncbi:MAG TPA: TetR/AcrR family transcriptional regulator [Solirubrobacterales bacterium]|nr:TetR/AcrR family transcriptional regulator [Solirubrobacterales bacterium]